VSTPQDRALPNQRNTVKDPQLIGRVPHGDPLLRRWGRTVTGMFTTSQWARDIERHISIVQQPVTTGRRLVVTSLRGGAGKTAVAALLASIYAARRRDAVLAADTDVTSGSLTWRLGQAPTTSLLELARTVEAARLGSLDSLQTLLPRTPTGLWVVPGGAGGHSEVINDITRWLSRLFAISLADCGVNIPLFPTTRLLAEAHAIIVVTPGTPDGVRTTSLALRQMANTRAGAALLPRVVIAVNPTTPHGDSALAPHAADTVFAAFKTPVLKLCYDRHLAAGAGVKMTAISEPMLLAATHVAATALDTALGIR
jgi:MinD-like ATPase involved in chromosome partitioning or flagellar assembly